MSAVPLPSGRWFLLAAVASLGFLADVGVAVLLDLLAVTALVLDLLLEGARPALEVERSAPAHMALEGPAPVRVRMVNDASRPRRVRVTDDLPAALRRRGDAEWDGWVPAFGEAGWSYEVEARERGIHELGDLHLRVRTPLGLVWRPERLPQGHEVRVQPGYRDLRRYDPLSQAHRTRHPGLRTLRQRGEGSSFESLREYVRGDDPRQIEWKASARHGGLVVRQYEAERSQNVVLALDAGRLMGERIGEFSRLDHALRAALVLGYLAESRQDRVGLFVFSDRVHTFLPPARRAMTRLTDLFQGVEARPVESDYPGAMAQLARRLRRRALVVLFTDVVDPGASRALLAHLGTASRRHFTVVVTIRNPEVAALAHVPPEGEGSAYLRAAAEEILAARSRALVGMRRAGVLVADVEPGAAVSAAVNAYLEVKRKALL